MARGIWSWLKISFYLFSAFIKLRVYGTQEIKIISEKFDEKNNILSIVFNAHNIQGETGYIKLNSKTRIQKLFQFSKTKEWLEPSVHLFFVPSSFGYIIANTLQL